jgi:hypothetical protein
MTNNIIHLDSDYIKKLHPNQKLLLIDIDYNKIVKIINIENKNFSNSLHQIVYDKILFSICDYIADYHRFLKFPDTISKDKNENYFDFTIFIELFDNDLNEYNFNELIESSYEEYITKRNFRIQTIEEV